ncbi:MAG: rhomboid family intramembrane serine protease [Steroidobacteraceae bacterium]|jgi:membrane associated rhomboid family serine protease|nr:rhomboid family intramembrane serine protease [Steroidobacteraceae bacterium]
MAPVTRTILIVTVAIYLLQTVAEPAFMAFALWPIGPFFRPWQIVTYAFLHGSPMHVFFNMFAVYMFGSELERYWGARRYVFLYLSSIVFAAIAQLIVSGMSGGLYPTVGASGGVFGLLLAYAVLFPRRRLMLIFPPIPMPAWLFVTLYGVIELTMGLTGAQPGVAHFAHIGGMLGGFLALLSFRARA